jgi:hypothetical protein
MSTSRNRTRRRLELKTNGAQSEKSLEALETKPILNFALRSCMLFSIDSALGGGG